jgi:phosphoribosyl 1,2-cyclic phosphate phosphodiesterase
VKLRLTLLGTGTSFGVPQLGCRCAVCCSADSRDLRTRSAALVVGRLGDSAARRLGAPETGRFPNAETTRRPDAETTRDAETTLLIDTPPELRLQLLAAQVTRIDAVLYTHEHADHVHGIDDLRAFSIPQGSLPLYGNAATLEFIREGNRYIFDPNVTAYEGTSKPSLELNLLEPGKSVTIAGLPVLPLGMSHGHSTVLGFRIGPLGYVTDAKYVAESERERLRGVDVLVLNALWWGPHPTHLSIPEAIETARAIGARRTILTHLSHRTAHAELAARLPSGIEPGYDGQIVEVGEHAS